MPDAIRLRLVTRIARRMVRQTYGGSRALVRWRKGRGSFDIRGSIFCEVRDAAEQPLCEFYAAAIRRLMHLFNIQVDVDTDRCRATGGRPVPDVRPGSPAVDDRRTRCRRSCDMTRSRRLFLDGVVLPRVVSGGGWGAGGAAAAGGSLRQRVQGGANLLVERGVSRHSHRRPDRPGRAGHHPEDRVRAFERLRVPVSSTLSHATVIRLGQLVGAATAVSVPWR